MQNKLYAKVLFDNFKVPRKKIRQFATYHLIYLHTVT